MLEFPYVYDEIKLIKTAMQNAIHVFLKDYATPENPKDLYLSKDFLTDMANIAAGGAEPTRNWSSWIGASAANSALIKASAGNLLALRASHSGSTIRWFQLFDRSTLPTEGATPIESIPLFTPGYIVFGTDDYGKEGMPFTNGVAWGFSSTEQTFTSVGDASKISVRVAWN